jgi:hypothetical protein
MIEVALVTLAYIQNRRNGIHSVTQGTRAGTITDFCFANGDVGDNCSSRIAVNILTDRALGSGYVCSSFSKVKMAEQFFFFLTAAAVLSASSNMLKIYVLLILDALVQGFGALSMYVACCEM